ncbi:TPA: diguanylate cyclase [Enterobacter cancerogenus]|nr:diguanylate cyclase [Enterobacter cancerogenus]HDR2164145.1 diguanylate cyclase [Enterobacter cancerogenus]HDR2266229.1 diguanylate cyclase [Enterobacter cancerogenus]
MNRKYREIDSIVRGLNNATDAHFKWLVKVLRFVARRDAELPEISCNNAWQHCEFGSWLRTQLTGEGGDKNYLLDIDKKHIAVHQACRELIITLDNDTHSPANFERFETALLGFTDALTRYKVHLLQLRTSYDALTGQPLRRILDESFDSMNDQYSDNGLFLMLIDVDHFKKVNDTYGHLAGDCVLRALAINLEDNIRRAESVYRYGGEEFIVLLQAENSRAATLAAEKIRRAIAMVETVAGEHRIRVTLTAGLTRVHKGEPLREVLERADMALYKGKHGGRNCTMLINRHLDCLNVSA